MWQASKSLWLKDTGNQQDVFFNTHNENVPLLGKTTVLLLRACEDKG